MPEPLTTRSVAEEPQTRDLITRSITVRADSIDEETRSIEAVMSTENIVSVFDWKRWDVIDEVLIARGAEMPDQVVLLENHRRWGLDDVLGSVRQMRVENETTVGRLFFDEDDAAERAWGKVKRKHVRDVSVGYRSLEFVDIEPNRSKTVGGVQYKARNRVLRITTRWELRELSLTPIGADSKAKTRNLSQGETRMNKRLRAYLESIGLRTDATDADAEQFRARLGGEQARICDLLETETQSETARFAARAALRELGRDPEDPTRALPANPPEPPANTERNEDDPPADPPNADAIRAEATRAERDRVAAIRGMATGVTPELVERAITDGWNAAQASTEFLRNIQDSRAPSVGSTPAIHSRDRDGDRTARTIAAGLIASTGLDPTQCSMFRGRLPSPASQITEQDAERGHGFLGMSTIDIVRECILADGGPRCRNEEDIADYFRSAGTSGGTLSYVFGTSAYAHLVAGWDSAQDTTTFAVEEDVANFLTQQDITFEASARMERLPRGDTAKHATVSDSGETYSIARYAKQIVFDEQDIIDDRLSALMGAAEEMGESARRLRPDLVYAVMLENPTMADTGAVWNSTAVTTVGGHANLGTGALAEATLKAAITAIAYQRDSNSNPLNIMPTHIVIPSDLRWTAAELVKHQNLLKLFADSSEPYYSTINQLAQLGITPVSDARLNATGVIDPRSGSARTGSTTNWWLWTKHRRGIRVLYRRGTGRRPTMRRFALDRGQWGIGYDINMDIGCMVAGWRGTYKSTGAA